MKNAWEEVVKGNTTKTIYKTKQQREWDQFSEACDVVFKYLHSSYHDTLKTEQDKAWFRAKVGTLTKRCGRFWEQVGSRVSTFQ